MRDFVFDANVLMLMLISGRAIYKSLLKDYTFLVAILRLLKLGITTKIIKFIKTKNNNIMPEIFRFLGMRFFYFSNDHLPIHVHVKNSDGTAKFEVKPVHLIESKGMKSKDLKIAEEVITDNEDLIVKHWKDYFKNDSDTNE